MTEQQIDNYYAWNDLGGHAPEELSIDSKRAMVQAGLGGKALALEVKQYNAHEEYERRHLSGVAERTPEQDASLKAFAKEARESSDAKAIERGSDPVLVAARRRARQEREQRGY